MQFYRFRVSSGLTGYIEIGPSRYSAAEEFVLTEYAARKWVSKLDLQSGKIIFAGEIGGEERQYSDLKTGDHYSSKAKQDGAMPPLDFEVITLPVLIHTTDASYGNQQWWNIPEDCVFEGFELNSRTPAQLSAVSPHHDFIFSVSTKTAYASGVDRNLMANAGFGKQRSKNVLVGSAGSYTDYTVAANSPTAHASGYTDLALTTTKYAYFGYQDKFCGLYFNMDSANAVAASGVVQYPQVSASGTVTWTNLSVTDGTISAGKSFAQDGAITWEQPSDWAPQVVASGSGEYYYVRIVGSAAFTAGTDADFVRHVVSTLKPDTEDPLLYTGDKLWLYLNTTGVATGWLPGTIYLRRVN